MGRALCAKYIMRCGRILIFYCIRQNSARISTIILSCGELPASDASLFDLIVFLRCVLSSEDYYGATRDPITRNRDCPC
jgi:hypothetical protein